MTLQNHCTDCTASVFVSGNCSRCYHFYLLLMLLQTPTPGARGCLCARVPVCVHVRSLLTAVTNGPRRRIQIWIWEGNEELYKLDIENFRACLCIKTRSWWTAIGLFSVPPTVVSKQTGLASTSFSLCSFRHCSLLNLLPQLEGLCPSQQAGILKLRAHFLSAAIFTSHPCAFALTYCWNDGGSDVSTF